ARHTEVHTWNREKCRDGDTCRHPDAQLLLVNEVTAAVLLPAGFVGLGAERLFLAIADRLDAAVIHAGRHQGVLDSIGAVVAESEVVFGRTTLVAMSFNREIHV